MLRRRTAFALLVPAAFAAAVWAQGRTDPFTRDPADHLLVSAVGGYNTDRFKFDAAVQYRRGTFRVSDVYSVETALE